MASKRKTSVFFSYATIKITIRFLIISQRIELICLKLLIAGVTIVASIEIVTIVTEFDCDVTICVV